MTQAARAANAMFIDLSLPRWNLFFPDVCSVETSGEGATNEFGEIVTGALLLEDHDNIGCQLETKTGKIVSANGTVVEVASTEIGLRGHFPAIEAGMTAIVAGARYKVIFPKTDSQKVKTILVVEAVN